MFNLPVILNSPWVLFVLITIVLALLFLGIFWGYFLLIEKVLNKVRKDEALLREKSYQEATKALENARAQSLKILNDANMQAAKILDSAHVFSEGARKSLEEKIRDVHAKQQEVLQKNSAELLEFYKKALAEEKVENLEAVKAVSEDLKEEAASGIEEFTDALEKETLSVQKMAEEKIQAEYSQLEKDLQEYKTKRLGQTDAHIYAMLAQVSKEVLGHAVSLEEHQDFVFKVLNEAKEQGSFGNG